MVPESPEHLFARFLADGDERALDALFRRCSPRLRTFALGLGLPRDRLEDLVHETLVTAVQRAEAYDPTQPLLPWLQGILARKVASHARDEARRRRHQHAWAQHRPSPAVDPAGEAADFEVRELLRQTIADVPARYRTALELHLLQGLQPQEIASRLGRLQVTVRVHLHRGLRLLRQRLPRGLFPMALAVLASRRADAAATAIPRSAARRAQFAAWTAGLGVGLAAFGLWRWSDQPTAAPATTAADLAVAAMATGREPEPPAGPIGATASREPRSGPPHAAPSLVQVVDATGLPVPMAGLCVEPAAGEEALPARRRLVTDERGTVHLSTPPTALRLRSDRGHDQLVAADERTVVLRCLGSATVRGTVTDALGRAVPCASVWLAAPRAADATGGVVTTTDAAGAFTLAAVLPGTWVAAFGPGGVAAPVPWSPASGPLVLRLSPAGAIQGQVVDATGAPVADAQVAAGATPEHAEEGFPGGVTQIAVPTQVVRTDAAGRFGPLWLPPGERSVHVRAKGHAPAVFVGTVVADATCSHTIALARARTVRGQVQDDAGAPVADAELVFRDADRNHRVGLRTDASGAFHFDAPLASAGVLCARAAGRLPTRCLVAPYAEVPPLLLRLARQPTAAGRLSFPDRRPVDGFAVRWITTATSALDEPEQLTTTAADGTFVVRADGDPAPRCSVRGRGDPVWHLLPEGALQWVDGQWLGQVPATFAPSAALHGRCLGLGAEPLVGARVFLRCDDGIAWESARTDAAGAFVVQPLAPGDYTVFVESQQPQQPCLRETGIVLRAAEQRTVDLRAGPAGTLSFALQTTDGQPAEGALVTVVGGEPERRYSARTGASGQQALPAGDYRLYAMGDTFAWIDGQPFRVHAGRSTELHLVVEPAVRTTVALQGLHAVGSAPCVARISRTRDSRPFGTFHLLEHALPSVMAFLPRGDYQVEVVPVATAARWVGEFTVDCTAPRHTAIPVALQPR